MKKYESIFKEHSIYELSRIGYSEGRATDFVETTLEAVYDNSYPISYLQAKLINLDLLTPITDEPSEWNFIGNNTWQNLRSPSLISYNEGKEYIDFLDNNVTFKANYSTLTVPLKENSSVPRSEITREVRMSWNDQAAFWNIDEMPNVTFKLASEATSALTELHRIYNIKGYITLEDLCRIARTGTKWRRLGQFWGWKSFGSMMGIFYRSALNGWSIDLLRPYCFKF